MRKGMTFKSVILGSGLLQLGDGIAPSASDGFYWYCA